MHYGGQHCCFIFWWELQVTWLNAYHLCNVGLLSCWFLFTVLQTSKTTQQVNISDTFWSRIVRSYLISWPISPTSSQVFAMYASSTAAVIYSSTIRSGKQETMEFFYNKNCASGHEGLKLQHETKLKLTHNTTQIWGGTMKLTHHTSHAYCYNHLLENTGIYKAS